MPGLINEDFVFYTATKRGVRAPEPTQGLRGTMDNALCSFNNFPGAFLHDKQGGNQDDIRRIEATGRTTTGRVERRRMGRCSLMGLFGAPEPPYDSKEEMQRARKIFKRRAQKFFKEANSNQVTVPLDKRMKALVTEYDHDKDAGEQEHIMELFEAMSKKEIRDLSRLVNDAREHHYPRDRGPDYGNLDRSLSLDQARRFFDVINNEKVARAFLLQVMFGLRIGELDSVRYQEENGLLRVENKKQSRQEFLPVHGRTVELMPFLEQIAAYSKNYLRNCFASIREDAGLTQTYGEDRRGRTQYQYTSHSLRHTAIKLYARVQDDNFKLCQFSRHEPSKEIGEVATYRHVDHDDLREELRNAFTEWYQLFDHVDLDDSDVEQDIQDIKMKGRWNQETSDNFNEEF